MDKIKMLKRELDTVLDLYFSLTKDQQRKLECWRDLRTIDQKEFLKITKSKKNEFND